MLLFYHLKKFLKGIGIDKSIAYSSGSRIIAAISGVLTIVFIASYLTKEQQGFYYTFGSIVALQVFFELGLTNILTQFVAQENAGIVWKSDLIINKHSKHHSRIAHLIRFVTKWYFIISIIFLISLLSGGIWFFNTYSPEVDSTTWIGPWFLISIATTLNLLLSPYISILSGLDYIKETSRISFFVSIFNPIAIWISFFLQMGLYSLGIGYLVSFITSLTIIIFSKLFRILKEAYRSVITNKINYKKEIFPYQWKIALSWASGYFVFQLFNPVLFATSGPIIAGQMGMTLSAVNGVASLSSSWISTKIPLFSKLIALKEYSHLDNLFSKTFKELGIICGVLLFLFFLLILSLRVANISFANRFLPIIPLTLLEIAILANQFGNCWAVYLRCHLKEPLLVNAIVGAISCALSTFLLGKYFGAIGMCTGYCILRIILSIWNYHVFKNKKNQWHCN